MPYHPHSFTIGVCSGAIMNGADQLLILAVDALPLPGKASVVGLVALILGRATATLLFVAVIDRGYRLDVAATLQGVAAFFVLVVVTMIIGS